MKKLLLVSLFAAVTAFFFSCKSTPEVEYECSNYFTKKDWEITTNKSGDSIFIYGINKNISLKSYFPNLSDSTKFSMMLYSEQYKKLPPPTVFSDMLRESLFKSKQACKNQATFKPYELSTTFMDGDSTITISVDFLASNSFGTPGELHATYTYDSQSFKLLDEYVIEY